MLASNPNTRATVLSRAWRQDVLDALLRVASIVTPIIVSVRLAFSPQRFSDPESYGIIASVALLVGLHFGKDLGYTLRAAGTLALLDLSAILALHTAGFAAPGVSALSVTTAVLAGVFFDRRVMLGVLFIVPAAYLIIGSMVVHGQLVLLSGEVDPQHFTNWVRIAINTALFSIVLGFAVEYVIGHVETSYGMATLEQEQRLQLERDRLRAEQQWERAAHELLVLGQLDVIESGNVQRAFAAIARAAARGLGAHRCSIWLLDESHDTLQRQCLVEHGELDASAEPLTWTAAFAPDYFEGLRSSLVLVVDDALDDPRTSAFSSYLAAASITSLLETPIRVHDRLAGVMRVEHTREPIRWSLQAQSFASSIAEFAARVLSAADRVTKAEALRHAYDELGQLHRQLESAKDDERRFLARELHDEMGQTLTALKLRLQLLGRTTPQPDAPLRVDEIVTLVDDLIARVRKISVDLRPPLLDEIGLPSAVQAFLEAQAAHASVRMRLNTSGLATRPSPEIEMACFRIVQEAVTNVLRHADASSLDVQLEQTGDRLHLRISDDGRGLSSRDVQAKAKAGHLGLVGMRERVRALGGELQLSAAIAGNARPGTRIHVILPAHRLA